MGRPKIFKNLVAIRFQDEKEILDNVDQVCAVLGWTRTQFLKSAVRVYLEMAMSKANEMGATQ